MNMKTWVIRRLGFHCGMLVGTDNQMKLEVLGRF